MIKEHDIIVLTSDLPEEGLTAGDVGTVVHIHEHGVGYEVEFMTLFWKNDLRGHGHGCPGPLGHATRPGSRARTPTDLTQSGRCSLRHRVKNSNDPARLHLTVRAITPGVHMVSVTRVNRPGET